MKYGVISFSAWRGRREAEINLGDTLQEFAVLNLYKRMGIDEKEVIRIDINDIHSYRGEYVLIPICINTSVQDKFFPMSERIIPCFVALSLFSAVGLSTKLVNYFKTYEPVGCRDESTMQLMREYGVSAYLAGCITATLPRREDNAHAMAANKAFVVDIAEDLIEKFPDELYRDYEVEFLSHIIKGDKYLDVSEAENVTRERMERYINEAALVITSRLHCLSPCMAFGIPVIGLFTNLSPRMGWIDKFLTLYTEDDMAAIDWKGKIVKYENIKEEMIDVAIRNIKNSYERYKQLFDVSYFFESRNRSEYGNYYKKMIKRLPQKKEFNYIIWGCAQLGQHVVEAMREWYPSAKLIGVIDTYQSGQFYDMPIEKPEDIEKAYKDVFCIVCTYSGRAFVEAYMESIGKNDYLSFASVNG